MSKTVSSQAPCVYVVGGDPSVESMFESKGWIPTSQNGLYLETHEPSLICFTGGADVSPELYGEKNTGLSHTNPKRDEAEQAIYKTYVNRIPMVGICRGGQFLHVMNGGKMIQHLGKTRSGYSDIHGFSEGGGSYKLKDHVHVDHHQGIVFPNPAEREPVIHLFETPFNGEEIVCTAFYKDTKCLCFQPHPEWGHEPTKELFFSLLKEYIGV